MKILHVIERTDHYGGAVHLLQLIKFLNHNEFKNEVICLSRGILTEKLLEMNIRFTVLNRSSYSALAISRRISNLAEKLNPDLLHCHDRISANMSLLATSSLRLPFVYNANCWSDLNEKSFSSRQWIKLNQRFLMNQARTNILPSTISLKEGEKKYKIPNAVVIPRGVDTHEFDPERPCNMSRKIYGIPTTYTVVGFLARLCRKRDPLTLIRAAALALREERKLHFLIVGDGELKEECLAETRRLGIENSVSFQSVEVNAAHILKIFDIYCLPSQWEGFSTGLMEAMAMKKAIITTPVQTNLDVIADHTDGLLVSAGRPEDWKEAIIELHLNAKLRKEMGHQARIFVERYYDVKKSVTSQASLYRKINTPSKGSKEEQPPELLYSI